MKALPPGYFPPAPGYGTGRVLAFILQRLTTVRFLLACLLALTFLARGALGAGDWQLIKIGGRDFLSIENIAKFYGFPAPVVDGRKIKLANSTSELEFQVDSREMLINGVRNWLSFPVFLHGDEVLVSRIDLAKTLEPQLRPNMIQSLGHVQTIVLDPGHGGFDKGAISSYGYEKDYALDVARQLRPMLQAKGFRVIMTRESDVFVPLEVRANIANATRNSVFVSLHFNATNDNPAATGFEVYSLTPRGAPSTHEDALTLAAINVQNGGPVDAASFELSTCVYHSVLGRLAEYDRGVKRARFAVLRLTRIPAVLMEGGFLTERGESRLIAKTEWRKQLAEAISTGIDNFRTLSETKKRPLLVTDYRRQKTDPAPSPAPEKSPLADVSAPPMQDRSFPSPGTSSLASPSPSATNGPQEP
ncbi:MAG: N-acetylmuramoyl-L-alanine amidase [Verrucomicrobiota bacterium]